MEPHGPRGPSALPPLHPHPRCSVGCHDQSLRMQPCRGLLLPGLRPFSIPGALRTIRRASTSGTCARDSSRDRHPPICWPLAFSKNRGFPSCAGALKSVGSVAVTGLVGAVNSLSIQPGASKAGRYPSSMKTGPLLPIAPAPNGLGLYCRTPPPFRIPMCVYIYSQR